jgi:hypothetical protein
MNFIGNAHGRPRSHMSTNSAPTSQQRVKPWLRILEEWNPFCYERQPPLTAYSFVAYSNSQVGLCRYTGHQFRQRNPSTSTLRTTKAITSAPIPQEPSGLGPYGYVSVTVASLNVPNANAARKSGVSHAAIHCGMANFGFRLHKYDSATRRESP